MNHAVEFPECPEYWENPNDVCINAECHEWFCLCKALTDTNFGMRHCPFYTTKQILEKEKLERKQKREAIEAEKNKCNSNASYQCPQLIFKIPKQLFK